MKTSMYLLFVFTLIFSTPVFSIPVGNVVFSDDFEDGDMNGWTVLLPTVVVSSEQTHSGTSALKMNGGNAAQVIKDDFAAMEGIYEIWLCVDDNYYSDGNILFQYQDDKNFYSLGCMPRGSDNPGYWLFKVVDGTYVTLQHVAADFDPFQWIHVKIFRHKNGNIEVYINDVLKLSVNDLHYMMPGGFVVGSYYGAYADDIKFTSMPEIQLSTDTHQISATTGGTIEITIEAGEDSAFRNYIILTGVSGHEPGINLPGGMKTLPLNWDLLTTVNYCLINSFMFWNFMNILNVYGNSMAQLNSLGPLHPDAVGSKINIAAALYTPWDAVSNAVEIEVVE